jgi:Tol biopolymer transport system component
MTGRQLVILCALPVVLFFAGGCGSVNPPYHIGVSPQGLIVFVGVGEGGSDLYLLDSATGKVSRLTKTPDYEQTPAFDPTGKLVVYAASGDPGGPNHIFVQPVGGGLRRQLTTGSSTCDLGPHFSADGKQLVFARSSRNRPYSMGGYVRDNWDIYESDSAGKSLRRLTTQAYSGVEAPCFCSKNRVLFMGTTHMTSDFDIYGLDTTAVSSAPRKLTSGSSLGCSADGKRMVFSDDRQERYQYEIWIANVDGTQRKQLTHLRPYTTCPVFDEHGQRILFLSDPGRDNHSELWQIDLRTGHTSRLFGSGLFLDPMGRRTDD